MRVGRKRLVLAAIVLVGLAVVVGAAWLVLGWPPPRFVLRYGLTPGCEPTGQTKTIEGVTFVEIGPGVFRMGSTHGAGGDVLGRICGPLGLPWGEKPKATNEMPVCWVEFPRGFWIAETEVTNAQFERFEPKHERPSEDMPISPIHVDFSSRRPVTNVSWEDARRYCAWLAERSGLPVRLPTEAEWESACRAGSRREFAFGDAEEDLAEYGWYSANAKGRAHEVGTRRANSWGLYDLHGNVWEWCEDVWVDSHEGAPHDATPRVAAPAKRQGRSGHVCRGGGFSVDALHCRSARRVPGPPDDRAPDLGFRPAFTRPNEGNEKE